MTTIEVKPGTKIGIDEILTGISNLDSEELDQFIDQLLSLRARRMARALSREETEILTKINRGLPEAKIQHLTALEAKRDREGLTAEEQQELMKIVEDLEQLNVERVQYIRELALIRGITVREVMEQLGIRPLSYG